MSLYFIPLIAAFIGWFVNWLTIKLLFSPGKRREQLVKELSAYISSQFNHIKDHKAIIPVVETYMDNFLREKLPTAMPVFKMFIGDSTINQVKGVFMNEIDNMLPAMIDEYLKNIDFEALIREKMDADVIAKKLRPIQLLGAGIGFVIGMIELFILL
jgi:uncharacterized membrane protein YheB (UPF0754 family)